MKTPAIMLAGLAVFATHASARSGTDYPHRDWGQVLTLEMSVDEATACIAREMRRQGPILVLPVDGGNDIDWTAGGLFQKGGTEAWVNFKIRREGDTTKLRIFYRHPIITKGLNGYVKKLEKQCLVVLRSLPSPS